LFKVLYTLDFDRQILLS